MSFCFLTFFLKPVACTATLWHSFQEETFLILQRNRRDVPFRWYRLRGKSPLGQESPAKDHLSEFSHNARHLVRTRQLLMCRRFACFWERERISLFDGDDI